MKSKLLFVLALLFCFIPVRNVFAQVGQESRPFEVQVLVLGGENYPLKQFRIGSADVCSGQHYHGGLVYSLTNKTMTDPAPGACGFGRVDQAIVKTIRFSIAEAENFKGLALVSSQELIEAKEAIEAKEVLADQPSDIAITFTSDTTEIKDGFFVEQERALQTTLIIIAPLVIISSAPLWGYIPHIPSLLFHFITWVLSLFGKKKQRRYHGILYDSITKLPLKLGIIRIFSSEGRKLIRTIVSDRNGAYDFLLPNGAYYLEVKKPQYSFPSEIVTTSSDAQYENIYSPEQGVSIQDDASTIPDIPLDQLNPQSHWAAVGLAKKILITVQRVGHYLTFPLLIIGFVISLLVLMANPASLLNWIIIIVYLLLFILQLVVRDVVERPWGVVYEMPNQVPLTLVSLQLIDPEFNKIVASRLSDYSGRFSFFAEPGKYILKAIKSGYSQAEEQAGKDALPKEISITKHKQKILGNIFMKKG